jgi:class 3 adenylate cyclase
MAESRKTVTIVFSDVTGSTALGEQTDPEVMRRIMERYFEEMRVVLERHGVAVAAASEYAQFTAEARVAFADVLRIADRPDEAAHELEEALRIYERKEFELSSDAVRARLAELQSSGSPSQ